MRVSSGPIGVSCLVAAAMVVLAATAAPDEAVLKCTLPDAILTMPIPQGWESNPRLAQDNHVLRFLNPTGMAKGAQVPIWLIVDRDSLPDGSTFANERGRILEEGKGYGFVPSDSAQVQTADRHVVYTYTFKTHADSLHHGLGILESPAGVILLRYQAQSEAIWMKRKAAIVMMLEGLRIQKL